MKAWLRGPDDGYDGMQIQVAPDQQEFRRDGITFIRHEIRSGLARWTEFWAEGWSDEGSGRV